MPSGSKPLPEPKLTPNLCHHMVSRCHDKLTQYPLGDVAMTSNMLISNISLVLITEIFKLNITLECMSENLIHGKPTLVQVMAWCRQATCHYMNQCWPRSKHHMALLGHTELTGVNHAHLFFKSQKHKIFHFIKAFYSFHIIGKFTWLINIAFMQ